MTHTHDHAAGPSTTHEGHSHGVSADADRGKLAIALALIVGFMLVEVVVGALVQSLALLSDRRPHARRRRRHRPGARGDPARTTGPRRAR